MHIIRLKINKTSRYAIRRLNNIILLLYAARKTGKTDGGDKLLHRRVVPAAGYTYIIYRYAQCTVQVCGARLSSTLQYARVCIHIIII